ncbi:TetR-like C-terminal domain-containing protein [Nocardioides convexus]|uniref:TetR-like C-terminal domain-containing protein n=1 Tax=Nocardioides convexus TaxID=2712224 RepID=UPI002418337F|nr:TetR-like C-terminal domain-containing protein [Nocardioides convexus]
MVPRISRREAPARPRIEGDREQEIFDATIAVLVDVGYDRLTMDAVAAKAKASKATLYRKWDGKAALVIDALMSQKSPVEVPPDTGSLRGDLLAMFCGHGGLTDRHQTALLGSVVTAIGRDPEFAAAFRERFIAPKVAVGREVYERAQQRGEPASRHRPRHPHRGAARHRAAPRLPPRRPADPRPDRPCRRPGHPPRRHPRLTRTPSPPPEGNRHDRRRITRPCGDDLARRARGEAQQARRPRARADPHRPG